MFKHISIISDENLNVMLDKELAYFRSIIERCQQSEYTIDEVVNMACEEFAETNPNLMKAVRACAYGVFGGLEDEYGPGIAFKAGVLTVPGVLTVLRLIDRQLEAEEMEKRMN
ncbi:MAG: hypothetical protein R6U37_03415 [Dehalococcoidia bacterium]